ncbi:helix-turn-helix domain-containing protein [Streptomyces sp. YS415]|uniref:helix-turn-helix domain-containing protein n=1 Tax=Streptomyces sp. YS415 TaxID=2944806 RepID=UPI0020228B60|nr:helix-turn-helix domain-containing protein [Streptomyces sp. YS415]MCL7429855.1 helix-turn-helix domain-containing protein [Streptomyces sp. YS415]
MALAQGEKNTVIAKELRVSVRSVERWRRAWREGSRQALHPSGPAKRPKIGDTQFAVLKPLLLAGAMAQGWADERWTLARVWLLIADELECRCRSAACGSCCGGMAGRGSSLPGGPSSGTRRRWPGG